MLKHKRNARRAIHESRRVACRRFLNETAELPEEMRLAVDEEIVNACNATKNGVLEVVDGDLVKTLSIIPSFKPETVKVIDDYEEWIIETIQERAWEKSRWMTPNWDGVEKRGYYGCTDLDDEFEVNKFLRSDDPATKYIIDKAILLAYGEKLRCYGIDDFEYQGGNWEEDIAFDIDI